MHISSASAHISHHLCGQFLDFFDERLRQELTLYINRYGKNDYNSSLAAFVQDTVHPSDFFLVSGDNLLCVLVLNQVVDQGEDSRRKHGFNLWVLLGDTVYEVLCDTSHMGAIRSQKTTHMLQKSLF